MPKQFEAWVDKNNDKITISNSRGTLPNFVKDNAKIVRIEVNPINTEAGRKIIQEAIRKSESVVK
ncbi:MAG: hypothetical protein FWH36_00725 [Lentimicrobiaceae bacterium]|nr:hypothetical protein [Lentimicrobiaceae bacterium]